MTSRPTVLASLVLALALLGDSLLYAVLPLHAATFGVSLASAGILLSANRIVRLIAYPFLGRIASAGLRRFTVSAAMLGASSTLLFAMGSGVWPLLASRLAWGVAFGSLSLSTLAYATVSREAAGRRVGLSLSLRELGPLASLLFGTAAVAALGVRPTLAAFGMLSLSGVLLAMLLPELRTESQRAMGLVKPRRADWLSLVAGLVADGIYPATVVLLLAQSNGAGRAIVGAGMLLAFKRVAVVLLAPFGGHAADRFGGGIIAAIGFVVTAAGAFVIAAGHVILGAVILSCGAAVTTTSLPLFAAIDDPNARVAALARLGMARDAGAAAGPLAALLLFDALDATVIYATCGVLLAAAAWPALECGGNISAFRYRGNHGKRCAPGVRSLSDDAARAET